MNACSTLLGIQQLWNRFRNTTPGSCSSRVFFVNNYWMVSVTVVEWLKLPLVPVMVSVRFPTLALLPTFTVSVEVPEPVTEVGLKLALTRDPNPLTLRFTVPANPFTAVMVTVYWPEEFLLTVRVDGDAEIVKSGTGAGFTTRVTVVECTSEPLVPVMVTV